MEFLSRRNFLFYSGGISALPFVWQKPELILYNGNFITMDPQQPRAQAVAIAGSRLVAVGTNKSVRSLSGPFTKSIDLQGRTTVPGFIDAHCHVASSGRLHLTRVDCSLDSIERIKQAIHERARSTPPGGWVFGFKYDDTKTKEGRYINRYDLDEAAPDHPVIITHRGGHTGFANSLAFRKANVSEDVADPPGGKFERTDGKLTGRLLETATYVFSHVYPQPTPEDFVKGVALMSSMLAKAGITSVHDAGASTYDLNAFHNSYEQGTLKTRVYVLIRQNWIDRMMEAGVKTGLGDEWVKVGPMKTAIDGSISERTARLSVPYMNTNDYGLLTSTPEELYEVCRKAHSNGWQIGVHANGDVGIDITLSVFERLQKEMPRKDPRFRLEHCTVINDNLVARIKALGAIPNPFSTYVYWHGEKMKYYGEERLKSMFALRSFLDAGIPVTQTSDYPPGPYEPMMALQSSVTRTDYTGKTWGANQKVTVEEAIKIGTMHGAYASYEETKKGSIQEGKFADLVVLSEDPTRVDPLSLMQIKVERTMAGGQWVYEA